ncbi:MAG: flagellar motor protein MotB [Candidatus Margulisbacteria bacterium]|nr:flagellar motor protein MotB [Candidatus Margulisiibacteriota bacterium]
MANKKADDPKPGSPAWMATFSDLMTQILVFFVFLFTMSSLDVVKMRTAMISFSAAFGGYSTLKNSAFFDNQLMVPYPETSPDRLQGSQGDEMSSASLAEKLNDIMFMVKANNNEEEIQGKYNDQGNLEIVIKDKLLFESGSATLKPESYSILGKIGESLADIDNDIIVEGHTDDVPPTSKTGFRSNWELSSARALSVAQVFIKNSQIRPDRFSIAGYGEYKPLVQNTSERNKAINRRVSVIIVKEKMNGLY